MNKSFYSVIIMLLFITTISFSQSIPQSINYQGLLKDASGIVVPNGDYTLTFKLYDSESGGTELWSETKLINVVEGIVNTQIGSLTSLTLSFDSPYWLGITVASGSELTPRIKLSSVPYSFMTMNVIDGSISSTKLQDGSVTLSKISDNSINSPKIIDGSINSTDIGSNQLIKSVNGIKDSVNLIAGNNVTITPNGNTITIEAIGGSGGGGTVTQVNTGDGLSGGPVTTTGTISIAPSGVTSTMILDGTITGSDVLDGTIATGDLSDNSVTSAKIVDGTVISTDILDLTVGTTDLSNNSVTTGKIVDATILGSDIASNQIIKSVNGIKDSVNFVAGSNVSITPSGNTLTISSTGGTGGGDITAVIAGTGLDGGGTVGDVTLSVPTSGITNLMLQDNSVTTTKIQDATITANDLGNSSVTTLKLDDNSVTSIKITDGTIVTADLSDNSITSSKIVDGTVTSSDILDLTVGTTDLANNSVTTGKIVDATILGSDIANNTIGAEKLNFTAGTVTNVSTGSGLTGGPVTTTGTISIANDGVTSAMILNGTITSADLLDGTIATGDLSDNSVTSSKIVDGTVTSTDILNGTITSTDIASTQVVKSLNTLTDNVTLVGGTNITITPSGNNLTINSTVGGIGGIGTLNYLPKFTATNSLGNSIIFDNGTNVGIGTTTPTAKLHIAGDANINGIIFGTGPGDILREYNTVAGGFAFMNNISGNSNVAIGREALYSSTTANSNIAIGFQSLYHSTTGGANTACGTLTLQNNNTGSKNTAIGSLALGQNYSGEGNTALGDHSGYIGAIFSYCTFIGYNAYSDYPVTPLTNMTGLGYDSRPTASNQVRIGNSSITSIGGYTGWTNLSDERYKTSIQENVRGLDFIMKLRPVTYQLNMNKLASELKEDQKSDENGNITNSPSEIDIKARNEKSQIVYTGFIAQEVEKAASELNFNFSGIDAPKNENDFYGLRYAEFVVPLVKAVQEQQETIQNQQKVINDLVKRIEALEQK